MVINTGGHLQQFYLPSRIQVPRLGKKMQVTALPFRLSSEALNAQLEQFNARQEIQWFGLRGAFQQPGGALVYFNDS